MGILNITIKYISIITLNSDFVEKDKKKRLLWGFLTLKIFQSRGVHLRLEKEMPHQHLGMVNVYDNTGYSYFNTVSSAFSLISK